MRCPLCDTNLEIFTEPDLDGNTWTFARCSKCGFEVGSQGATLAPEELASCLNLRRQLQSQDVASRE